MDKRNLNCECGNATNEVFCLSKKKVHGASGGTFVFRVLFENSSYGSGIGFCDTNCVNSVFQRKPYCYTLFHRDGSVSYPEDCNQKVENRIANVEGKRMKLFYPIHAGDIVGTFTYYER